MEIIAQYPFDFLGALFELYETNQHGYYLPIKGLCDTYDLNYKIELSRIKTDENLAKHVVVLRAPILYDDNSIHECNLECLQLQRIPFWACTIDSQKVKKIYRELFVSYKNEMARALWEINFPRVSVGDVGLPIHDEEPYKPSQFTSYVQADIQKPDQPPSIEKIRIFFYWGKIVDLCWFEGDLPSNATDQFDCYQNPKWPYQSNLPENVGGIMNLSEPELQLICHRIKKPNWVGQKTRTRGMSLDKIPMDWNKGGAN